MILRTILFKNITLKKYPRLLANFEKDEIFYQPNDSTAKVHATWTQSDRIKTDIKY